MAKQYEQYKKEFDAWKKALQTALQDKLNYESNRGQMKLMMMEGANEMGLRAQKLRAQGHTGKTIDDFKNDGEIKAMLKTYDNYCTSLERDYKALDAARTKLAAGLKTMQTSLAAEIKARQKQLTTKLGVGNKSLGDMKKLAQEMQTVAGHKPTQLFLTKKLLTVADFRVMVDKFIVIELAKSKDKILSDRQEMLEMQLLNDKVLKRNLSQAKKQLSDLQQSGAEARTAVTAKDAPKLKTAQTTVARLAKAVVETVTKYDQAMSNSWIANAVDSASNKAAIKQGLTSLRKLKPTAELEAAAVKKLKIAL